MPSETRTHSVAWTALAAGLLLGLVALFAAAPIFAVDFFWHLKLGELIAQNHAIPQEDMFSAVHPARHYVQFQWLWELLVYGAYSLDGLRGVRLFQVATLTLSFALLGLASVRLLRSRTVSFCFCAFALVLFEDRFQARPSATVLGFVALILPWLVDERARAGARTWLLALVVACLWSNVHGGESLLMVLAFGALGVGSLLALWLGHGSRAAAWRDGKLALASLFGVFLSPAFVAGLQDWARAIGPQLASHNKEWRPSYTMLENGLTPSYLLIGLGPTLVALAYVIEQRSLRGRRSAEAAWPEWFLCGGLLLLSQLTVRNAFLCLVPLCFMLVRFGSALPRRTQRLVGALALMLLLVAFTDHVIAGYGGVAEVVETIEDDLAPQAFPVELAAFMREAQIEGGILDDGRWGGYLIWELWPRCHVFVDTRHDLTEEMWPVFLASHVPQTRPAAMTLGFQKWGLELAVFRGPTFPAVIGPPEWLLLYKAGDQELYQHRAGAHAASNLARGRAWLGTRASAAVLEADYARAATEVGASVWLAAPAQRRLRARAELQRHSPLAADRNDGLFTESELSFDAGRYQEAYRLLGQLVFLDPPSALALYRYALAAFAVEQPARASWALDQLRERTGELSKLQLGRLAVLDETLRSKK
ncbi:MAG: hypothetical protein JWN04_6205 [Myxococcaceae bacterium]|nr:hypothetical protein [Myxococcaceae bacterium]